MAKILYRMVAVLCIAGLLVGIWRGLRYVLVDDTASYTRVMMHEFYNQDNIDVLFSGASLCYESFDIGVLDEKLGVNTFNAGSSSQDLDASYTLIKECIDNYDVNQIYLELSPIMATNMDIEQRDPSNMTGSYLIMDYLKPSLNKLEYMLSASKKEYYAESFLVARRSYENIFSVEKMTEIVRKKRADAYRNFTYENLRDAHFWYVGKGYVECDVRLAPHVFYDSYGALNIDLQEIHEDWFATLDKIINYCNENGVELTLVCAPLSNYLLAAYGEKYGQYHDRIAEIATQGDVKFYDFTLCKEKQFGDAALYRDGAHLNMFGARVLSNLLGDIENDQVRLEDISYGSAAEKLEAQNPELWGIAIQDEEMKIVATHPEEMLFSVSIEGEDATPIVLQEWEANTIISLPEGYTGRIHVSARCIENDEIQEGWFTK